jgi:hypothetical protein
VINDVVTTVRVWQTRDTGPLQDVVMQALRKLPPDAKVSEITSLMLTYDTNYAADRVTLTHVKEDK